jgi:acetyl-CoA acetyltransferase family protein
MITPAYLCDAIRTPFCPEGGRLASLRADDLAALPLLALIERHPGLDWEQVADVVLGCAHQIDEEQGDVARTASLLADLPASVPGVTLNRECGSGLEAIGAAARAIKSGEIGMALAGGIESSSRLASRPGREGGSSDYGDTSKKEMIRRRSMHPMMRVQYGDESAIAVADRMARELRIERDAQDAYTWYSHQKAVTADRLGWLAAELAPVTLARTNGDPLIVEADELHPPSSPQALTDRMPLLPEGSVTAGNVAFPGDGACGALLACEKAAQKYSLLPRARILGMAVTGVEPGLSGIGAAAAVRKLLVQVGLNLEQVDVIELHEAFAVHALAAIRDWGLRDDDPRVNPHGGALAYGDPVGASGARLVTSAMHVLHRLKGRYALCAMCVGSGQGIALAMERV